MTKSSLSSLLILVIVLSGCSSSSLTEQPEPPATQLPNTTLQRQSISTVTPVVNPQTPSEEFAGRVIDMQGVPIQGAYVESLNTTAVSDADGWFKFVGEGLPRWIKVTAKGFISRTRAATPGVPVLFRLTRDDGKTIVVHFAGDTMFGRRFYDPNGDDILTDGFLPLAPTVDDHMRLLAPVKPLLENADFSVVNFETTLSSQPFLSQNAPRPASFHPTAPQVYASHPNSAIALKQSGVDIVNLGNNHMYDMLQEGLNNTLSILDQAGMLRFGAGADEASAWEPLIISSKGQTIAFIGCTSLRIPSNTPIRNDIPYVASDVRRKGGAAYCAEVALRSAIKNAKEQADVVIVMIHGGREYDRTPTQRITYLTGIATQAGATLVVNHHPHVVSGFSQRDQALVAWSIGNFFYDQTVWPSLESYMLAVYLQEGKVIRAYIEPLMIDGFVPHGLSGELADFVVRGAAGRMPGPFIMESGSMEVDLASQAIQHSYTQTMDGGPTPGQILAIPQAEWISDFNGSGKLLLGRDLLWVGGFENNEIGSPSHGAPLWDLNSGGVPFGRYYAYAGELGIRLTRDGNHSTDAVSTNLRRVILQPASQLSITGMIRMNPGATVHAQLSWYSSTSGPSFLKTTQQIEVQSYDAWHPFRFDVHVPPKARALGLYLRLKLPGPEEGKTVVDFDNIRIIEWARPSAPYSPLYNFALLTGTGEITFTQEFLPGAEAWRTTAAFAQNK